MNETVTSVPNMAKFFSKPLREVEGRFLQWLFRKKSTTDEKVLCYISNTNALRSQLTWTHYSELLKVEGETARSWYIRRMCSFLMVKSSIRKADIHTLL